MHQICHIELPASDYDKVKQFYGEIFGWTFEMVEPMDYMIYRTPEGVGGGFDKNMKPVTGSGPMIHLMVDNIDAVLPKIESMGGKTVKPRTEISQDIGSYAVFNDCEGNQMALYQPPAKQG